MSSNHVYVPKASVLACCTWCLANWYWSIVRSFQYCLCSIRFCKYEYHHVFEYIIDFYCPRSQIFLNLFLIKWKRETTRIITKNNTKKEKKQQKLKYTLLGILFERYRFLEKDHSKRK